MNGTQSGEAGQAGKPTPGEDQAHPGGGGAPAPSAPPSEPIDPAHGDKNTGGGPSQ